MIPRPLELHALKVFKPLGEARVLLAVSGGLDSMALLHLCAQIRHKVSVQFIVAHVHHGSGVGGAFRDRAQQFVGQTAADLSFDFITNPAGDGASSSEANLRKFRLAELKKFKIHSECDYVVFAHHADDLLETRLIRLIRGTGPKGLLAMSERRGVVLRPLLRFSKAQLESYLATVRGRSLDDPSNNSVAYLRNWIRREWLPALERKRPGSTRRLDQSLANLVESLDTAPSLAKCYENSKILRQEFHLLSPSDKRRVLGAYLQQSGFQDYGLSHINELIKRLDVERKDLTFRLLKKIWLANAKHIWCE